ncbi:hypothetical protein ACP70R_018396 [Stipagrostis hirtigluma subsp. patula]
MAHPLTYLRSYVSRGSGDYLLQAALDGNLGLMKGIIRSLGIGNGNREAVFSFNKYGLGVLHYGACRGHLEVCKHLVEELGGDPNMTGASGPFEGLTPFMASAQSGDVSTVNYFLDHGGDVLKADVKGRSVLHHAVCTGRCTVTEFLLSKGIPVDIDHGCGTPLFHAATNEQDKTLKILLDHHANPNTIVSDLSTPLMSALLYRSLKCMELLIKAGADVNAKGALMSPLVLATMRGGYTNFIQFLLKAGADPNIPDGLGRLPIVLSAERECREEVEMLLPLTSPIPNVYWSIDGVISHAKFERTKPLDKGHIERRKAMFKSQADLAFRQKEYATASKFYSLALDHAPDATVYSNRSLCKLKMGDGEGALSDAYQCRMMRPDWAEAWYRQAAAHMLLKEYKQACDALLDAEKLDPENDEIKRELRKAVELMKTPPDEDQL